MRVNFMRCLVLFVLASTIVSPQPPASLNPPESSQKEAPCPP